MICFAKDAYDVAIDVVKNKNNLSEIYRYWGSASRLPTTVPYCLFRIADNGGSMNGGCLTMIKGGRYIVDGRNDLTELVRKDIRLPLRPEEITVENLSVFAEWQRRLDVELDREPPDFPAYEYQESEDYREWQ